MGKYDNVDRIYFANKERFAELITVGIYRKRLRIKGEELQLEETIYPSSTGNGMKERDAFLGMLDERVKYGVEIENYADLTMPRRFLSYETGDYEKQAKELEHQHKCKKDLKGFVERKSKMKEEEYYVPVLNMLLYLGTGHWKGRCTMRDMIKVPEKYKPYIQDKIINYSFSIMEADYVNPMDFHTDLRQFFQMMQCRNNKQKIKELLSQEEFRNLCTETQRVIAVHLDNKEIMQNVIEEEQDMCKALDDWAKEERAIGREEGIKEGIKENLLSNLRAIMNSMNLSLEQAMDVLNVDISEREEYKKILG